MVWLALNWNHKIVRRTSPLFMLFVTIGVAMVLIAGILLSIGLNSSAQCILYDFFIVMGTVLILSSLLAKNYRMYLIFHRNNSQGIRIRDKNLLKLVAVLLFIALAQFFIYSFAGGPVQPITYYSDSNQYYAYELCASPTAWFQTFRLIAYYVYLFILIVAVGVLGFLTRNIHENFNESKNLAIIVYIYLCMGIIYVPLYYVQGDSTSSEDIRYLIVAINMTVLMIATLVILFSFLIYKTEQSKRKAKIR